ncbi:uncharacterized protein I206_104474 [Kwoniella pini CBS 10737]|uniref:Uncharacterized protein n=1 Tax=Kwoniella pini CBS 10737 TaxID=1296096 RepID=A0A1B9I6X6_9TREE|nr:uncharacterized protein I206_02004 [Kwoniella pini CBS 10737]OCF51290.1 hypothetical protein I206_02004 [Kwoniella pini CBS 10737]
MTLSIDSHSEDKYDDKDTRDNSHVSPSTPVDVGFPVEFAQMQKPSETSLKSIMKKEVNSCVSTTTDQDVPEHEVPDITPITSRTSTGLSSRSSIKSSIKSVRFVNVNEHGFNISRRSSRGSHFSEVSDSRSEALVADKKEEYLSSPDSE